MDFCYFIHFWWLSRDDLNKVAYKYYNLSDKLENNVFDIAHLLHFYSRYSHLNIPNCIKSPQKSTEFLKSDYSSSKSYESWEFLQLAEPIQHYNPGRELSTDN